MKNFLYIFEDGELRLGPKPSDTEIEGVENGELLQIINLKKKQHYVPGEGWADIEVMDLDIDEETYEEEEFDD